MCLYCLCEQICVSVSSCHGGLTPVNIYPFRHDQTEITRITPSLRGFTVFVGWQFSINFPLSSRASRRGGVTRGRYVLVYCIVFDISVLAYYVEDDVIEEWRASTDNRRDLKESNSFVDSTLMGYAIGATMAWYITPLAQHLNNLFFLFTFRYFWLSLFTQSISCLITYHKSYTL